jgi:hypothetical protein
VVLVSDIHINHRTTLGGQSVEFVYIKPDGM